MKKLIKVAVGGAIIASIVGSGIWAAINLDFDFGSQINFDLQANVVVSATAERGTLVGDTFTPPENEDPRTFFHDTSSDDPAKKPTSWNDIDFTMTKVYNAVVYSFSIANIGEGTAVINFTPDIDTTGTPYEFDGGIVSVTGLGGVDVIDEYTGEREVEVGDESIYLLSGHTVVFTYMLCVRNATALETAPDPITLKLGVAANEISAPAED